jgi:hypothetical protein
MEGRENDLILSLGKKMGKDGRLAMYDIVP